MQADNKEQETIRLYLLGQATQEDSSSLEERLLIDSVLFQALLIAEDELIDQYLSDKLTAAERQSFETHFLIAPERQRKLRFGLTLHKYENYAATSEPLEQYSAENVSDEKSDVAKPPPKRGLFSFLPFSYPIVSHSLAAAMLLIVVGGSWAVFNNWRQQAPQQPGNVYVVTLTPGLTRDSGELKRVAIQGQMDGVQFQLALPDAKYQKYKVELQNSESQTIYTQQNLAAQLIDGSQKVVLTVPAKLLAAGDYQLRLSGLENAGHSEPLSKYSFRVLRP